MSIVSIFTAAADSQTCHGNTLQACQVPIDSWISRVSPPFDISVTFLYILGLAMYEGHLLGAKLHGRYLAFLSRSRPITLSCLVRSLSFGQLPGYQPSFLWVSVDFLSRFLFANQGSTLVWATLTYPKISRRSRL